jgi:sugar lactone lactonase YvrE
VSSRDANLKTIVEGLTFPEGPRWHDGRLWFSDFYSRRVLAMNEAGTCETIIDGDIQPSGLGWTPDGDLLVVSMLDRSLMKRTAGKLVKLADLSALAPWHCNDMVVDQKGRAYVGNFGFDNKNDDPRVTRVIRVDPDGRATVAADDMWFPNGSVITADGKTMIIAETYALRLTAFDIADDGGLSNRRVFAQLTEDAPDGIALDEEGAVWVASPRMNRCIRVFEGGKITQTVATGDRGSFACMLGGDDRKTLYICSCRGDHDALNTGGAIEAIKVNVPGTGMP